MAIPALQMSMINGDFVDRLSVQDRGLGYGDGLFETMRLQRRRVPLLRYHLDRLASGCARLQLKISPAEVRRSLEAFVEALPRPLDRAIVKLIVTRGAGGWGCKPPGAEHQSPTLIFQSFAFTDNASLADGGVTLEVCRARISDNPLLAGIKHLSRLDYVLAAQELPDDPGVQGLLLNQSGDLVETIHHNIFLVKKGILWTPRLSRAGVAGVMRRVVMEELGPRLAGDVREGDLSVDEIRSAEELFICNSVRGFWPVRRFLEVSWAAPGPITSALQKEAERLFEDGL